MVNVSAISPNSLPRLPGVTAAEYRQQQHQHTESRQVPDRQRRQRASTDSFCVFLFWGEGVETRCSCCRALYPVCWRGLAEPTPEERKPAAAEGSTQREARTTDRPPSSPEQRTRESLAERRLRTLWRPVEPADVPASPHQSQRATAGGAVWASSADAARLRRRGSGCSAARRSQGAPPAARAPGPAGGGWWGLFLKTS